MELSPGAPVSYECRSMIYGVDGLQGLTDRVRLIQIPEKYFHIELLQEACVTGGANQDTYTFPAVDQLFRDVASQESRGTGDEF